MKINKKVMKYMKFNPKLSDFVESKKDITIMGLWWAGYWRLLVCIGIAYLVIFLVALILA